MTGLLQKLWSSRKETKEEKIQEPQDTREFYSNPFILELDSIHQSPNGHQLHRLRRRRCRRSMVVLVEDLDLFSFFHNKTHIESHVQVH